MVIHLPSNLRREMIVPRLGWTCAVIFSLFLCGGGVWSRLHENERAVLLPTAVALAFWISIRALLRAGRPPDRILPSIIFTLHLLNLCGSILLLVFGLLGLLKGPWWEWWR